MPKIIVFGDKRLNEALQRLGDPRLINKIARGSMRAAMKPIHTAAKSNAPVGETGDLKDAIKLRAGKVKRGSVTFHVNLGNRDFKGRWFYGAFRALGTHYARRDAWMQQAYEGNKATARAVVEEQVWKGISAEAKKR